MLIAIKLYYFKAAVGLFSQLLVIIAVGVVGGLVAKRFKAPLIVGYIIGGAVLAVVFPISATQADTIKNLAEIGVALLLFSIGIEFSLDKLLQVKKYAIAGAAIQITLTIVFGILIFPLLGFDRYASFFLGAVASLSSTAVVVKVLEEMGIVDDFSSQIAIGWLVMQDIAVVVLVILIGGFAPSQQFDGNAVVFSLLKSFILIAVALVLGRTILPRIIKSLLVYTSRELIVVAAFGFCLLFSVLAEKLGISSTLGAFLAGLMISESVINHEIFTEIKPLQAIFTMVFFIAIGNLFSVGYLFNNILLVLAVFVIIILLKILIVLAIGMIFKLHVKLALQIAIYLAQIGEFAFLISQIAFANKWISQDLNSLVVAVTILSLITAPSLIVNSEKIYDYFKNFFRKQYPGAYRRFFTNDLHLSDDHDHKDHVIICGGGRVGSYIAKTLDKLKDEYVVIEINQDLAKANENNPAFMLGDATNPDILTNAGILNAKVIVVTLPKSADAKEVIRTIRELNPDISILLRKHLGALDKETLDQVFAFVEPEFETAVKMLEKLMLLLHHQPKRVSAWIKDNKELLDGTV